MKIEWGCMCFSCVQFGFHYQMYPKHYTFCEHCNKLSKNKSFIIKIWIISTIYVKSLKLHTITWTPIGSWMHETFVDSWKPVFVNLFWQIYKGRSKCGGSTGLLPVCQWLMATSIFWDIHRGTLAATPHLPAQGISQRSDVFLLGPSCIL